jgi:hypothetical protein
MNMHDRSKRKKIKFLIGMEHGNSEPQRRGEQAVIQAFREAVGF